MKVDLDRVMYLVVVDHPKGPYIPETDLDRTDLTTVARDIRDRQYTDVLAVLELNPVSHTLREVTHDFRTVIDQTAD